MDFIVDDFQSLESISSGYSPQKTPRQKNILEYPTPLPPKNGSSVFQSIFALPQTSSINNSTSPGDSSHSDISSHFRSRVGAAVNGTTCLLTTRTTPVLVTWEIPLSAEPHISDEALERRLKRAQRYWERQRLRWCVLSTRHICIRRLGSRVRARNAWQKHVERSCRRAISNWQSHGSCTIKSSRCVASAEDQYRRSCLKLGLSALKRKFVTLIAFRKARTSGEKHWQNRIVAHALSHWVEVLEISSVIRNHANVADNHYSRRWVMIESSSSGHLEEDEDHAEKIGDFYRVRGLNFSEFSLNSSEQQVGSVEDFNNRRDGPPCPGLHSHAVVADHGNGLRNLCSSSPFAAFRSVPSSEQHSYAQTKKWPHRPLESPFAQYKLRAPRHRGGDYCSPRVMSLSTSFRHGGRHHDYHLPPHCVIGQEAHSSSYRGATSDGGSSVKLATTMPHVLSSPTAYLDKFEVRICQQPMEEEERECNTDVVSSIEAPISVVDGTVEKRDDGVNSSNIGCNNDVETDSLCVCWNATAHLPIGGEVKAVTEYAKFDGGDIRRVSSFDLQQDVSGPCNIPPSSIETASLAASSRDVEEMSTIGSSTSEAQLRMIDGEEEEDPYDTWKRLQNSLNNTNNNLVKLNAAVCCSSSSSLRLQIPKQTHCDYNDSNYDRAKWSKIQKVMTNLIEKLAIHRSLRLQSISNYNRAKWLRLRNSLEIFVEQIIASFSLRLQRYSNYEISKRLRSRNGLKYFVKMVSIRQSTRLKSYSYYERAKRWNLQNSLTNLEQMMTVKRGLRTKGYYDDDKAKWLYTRKGLRKWLMAYEKWVVHHAHQNGIQNVNNGRRAVVETMLHIRKGLRIWLTFYQRSCITSHGIKKAEKHNMIMIIQRTLRVWWHLSHEANHIRKTLRMADRHFTVNALTQRGIRRMHVNARISRMLSVVIAKFQLSMFYRSARYSLRWWEYHMRIVRFVIQHGFRNRLRRCISKWHLFVTQHIAERIAFNQGQLRKVLYYWKQQYNGKRLLHLAHFHFYHLTCKKAIVYWVELYRMRLVVIRALSTFRKRLVMRYFQVWFHRSQLRLSQRKTYVYSIEDNYYRHRSVQRFLNEWLKFMRSHQNCNLIRIYKGVKHWQTIQSRKGLRMLRYVVFVSKAYRTISKRYYFMAWWATYSKKKINLNVIGAGEYHHCILMLKSAVSTIVHRKGRHIESKCSIVRAKQHFYLYAVAKGSLWNRSLKIKALHMWSACSHHLREIKGRMLPATLHKEGKLLTTLCRFLEYASFKRQHTSHMVVAWNNFMYRMLHKALQRWQFRNCQTRAIKNLCRKVDISSKDGTFAFDDATIVTRQQQPIPTSILHDLRFISFQTGAHQYSTKEAQNMLKWWKNWAVIYYVQHVRLRLGILHYRKSRLCSAWKRWKKQKKRKASTTTNTTVVLRNV